MQNNKTNLDNRETRARKAKEHTDEMEARFLPDILESVKSTIVYGPSFTCKKDAKTGKTEVIVDAKDSVSAVFKYSSGNGYERGKCAVLNFASYKNPGGGFAGGSKAQEECLCHSSFLYDVLARMEDYYSWNHQHKNRSLYENRALYSPRICFQDDESSCWCDVITCAAPNRSAAQSYENVTDRENTAALESRIRFVLDIAKENEVETLILGAFGCGVFGQEASETAGIFKKLIEESYSCFERIIFAIPNGTNGNYESFRRLWSIS